MIADIIHSIIKTIEYCVIDIYAFIALIVILIDSLMDMLINFLCRLIKRMKNNK